MYQRVLYLLAAFLFCFAALGEEEKGKDYSTGLGRLAAMGLPDLKGAKLVSLAWQGRGVTAPINSPIHLDSLAWVLKRQEDGTSRLFLAGPLAEVSLECLDQEEIHELGENLSPTELQQKMRAGAFTNEANVSTLTRDFVRQLKRHLRNKKQQEKQGYWNDPGPGALLWATMLYAQGAKQEANEIADLAFSLTEDKKALLERAVSAMGTGRYNGIILEFQKTGNWQTFHDQLKAMLEKAAQGWEGAAAAAEILKTVSAAADGLPPALPAEGFSQTQKQAAEGFLRALGRSHSFNHYDGNWLLAPTNTLKMLGKDHAITRFFALRTDALPVLAHWLTDDAVAPALSVPPPAGMVGVGNMQAIQEMLAEAETPEQARMLMEAMEQGRPGMGAVQLPAPMKRAEVAKECLRTVFPSEAPTMAPSQTPPSPAEVRALAERLAGQTDVQIARFYLKEGNEMHRNLAITFLCAHAEGDDLRAVEEAIINEQEEYRILRHLGAYVRGRGEDGAEFVAKVAKVLPEEEYVQQQLANIKQQAGIKEEKTGDEPERTLKELIRDFLTADSDGQEMQRTQTKLQQALSKAFSDASMEAIDAVIEATGKTGNTEKAMQLIQLLSLVRYQWGREQNFLMGGYVGAHNRHPTWEDFMAGEDDQEEGTAATRFEFSATEKWDAGAFLARARKKRELWDALLSTEKEANPHGMGTSFTLGQLAASTFLMLVTPDIKTFQSQGMQRMWSLPDQGRTWSIRSAKAILAGERDDPYPMPDPADVSQGRRKEIANSIQASAPGELGELLASLSQAEYLAALELADEQEDVAAKLSEAALTLGKCKCNLDDEGLRSWLAECEGKKLSVNLLKSLHDRIRKRVAQGQAVTATVVFNPKGARIEMVDGGSHMARMYGGAAADMPAMIMMNLVADGDFASAHVKVERKHTGGTGQGVNKDPDQLLDAGMGMMHMFDADAEEEFWETAKRLVDGELNVLSPQTQISMVGMCKTQETEEGDDD